VVPSNRSSIATCLKQKPTGNGITDPHRIKKTAIVQRCKNSPSLVTVYLIQAFDCMVRFLPVKQGCQMVCFQTKNPNLGKFWRFLQWKIMLYFMAIWSIWYILLHYGIFCGHLVCFDPFWYIVPRKIWQPCCQVCLLASWRKNRCIPFHSLSVACVHFGFSVCSVDVDVSVY
jgi:hypothetical protein